MIVAAGGDEWQSATDATSASVPKAIWGNPRRVPNRCESGDETFFSATGAGDEPGPVDRATMLLYVGHGLPGEFEVHGQYLGMSGVLLGDSDPRPENRGMRYGWFCSCQLFAHGPLQSSASRLNVADYGFPGRFDPARADESVYQTILQAMGSNLRMACGASTYANCGAEDLREIWNDHEEKRFDVADSFLYGVLSSPAIVPICLATGGSDPTESALYDQDFSTLANSFGESHVHLEYVQEFASNEAHALLDPALPEIREVLRQRLQPAVEMLRSRHLAARAQVQAREVATPHWNGASCPKVKPGEEGLLYCRGMHERGKPVPAPASEPPAEQDPFLRAASDFVQSHGWCNVGQDCQRPRGYRLLIDSVSREAADTDDPPDGFDWKQQVKHYQKGVLVTFKRLIMPSVPAAGAPVEVVELGRDGTIVLALNNDAEVVNAARLWRPLELKAPPPTIQSYLAALQQAKVKVGQPELYDQIGESWGYQQADDGSPAQLSFLFYFVPRLGISPIDTPPKSILIPFGGG